MNAQITKVEERKSKVTGKTVYFVCFSCEDGVVRNAWIDTGFRNYSHWQGLLKEGIELKDLVVKGKIVNADSYPRKSLIYNRDEKSS